MDNQTIIAKLKSWACNSDIQLAHDVLELIDQLESVQRERDELSKKVESLVLDNATVFETNEIILSKNAELRNINANRSLVMESLQRDKAALIEVLERTYDCYCAGLSVNAIGSIESILTQMKG